MEENDILNHFLDASTEIESAEQVAKSVVGKIIFIVLFEEPLPVYVVPLYVTVEGITIAVSLFIYLTTSTLSCPVM